MVLDPFLPSKHKEVCTWIQVSPSQKLASVNFAIACLLPSDGYHFGATWTWGV